MKKKWYLKLTIVIALFAAIPAFGQEISNENGYVFTDIIHQNNDLDMVIVWDFFGINKVCCHNKTNRILMVEHTVLSNTLTSYVYPGSTVELRRYDQCVGQTVTYKYWKKQSPFGTGNTQWLYCGQYQFFVE